MTRTQPAGGVTTSWRPVWGGLLLVLLVVAVYQPVWNAGFVWDDNDHLTQNPAVNSVTGLRDIWSKLEVSRYYPLTLTSFWLQCRLWGLEPGPYHLVNILVHAANAVLLFFLLRRLFGTAVWTWWATAIWAAHPVNVESVAWITELKNTQSTCFFLASLLLWERSQPAGPPAAAAGKSARAYTLSVICGFAAITSKPATVVLPAVLVLIEWWKRRPFNWRLGRRLVPFILMAAAMSVLTITEQQGYMGPERDFAWTASFAQRLALAGKAVVFYAAKILAPVNLMFVYPRWEIDVTRVVTWLPLLGLIVGTAGLVAGRTHQAGRACLLGWMYYVVALSPVLGFFGIFYFRYSLVADHFQYLAGLGLVSLMVAGLAWLTEQLHRPGRVAVATAILVLLATLTWRQARVYHDVETLWRDTLAKNPACWLAHNNLGNLLRAAGRSEEAIHHLEMAIDLKPDVSEAYLNLGSTLTDQGRFAEAIVQYREGLRTRPTDPRAHYCLALALSEQGEVDEALVHYREAVRFKPDYTAAHFSLARELMRRDALVEATIHYRAGLRLAPNNSQAHNNLGVMLARQGRLEEAIRHYREALRLQPEHRQAANNLKQALAIQQNPR